MDTEVSCYTSDLCTFCLMILPLFFEAWIHFQCLSLLLFSIGRGNNKLTELQATQKKVSVRVNFNFTDTEANTATDNCKAQPHASFNTENKTVLNLNSKSKTLLTPLLDSKYLDCIYLEIKH
ncbi:hypothetical protein XELAEV_18021121mg [Xenopus laevis]|uniref:Uncharacterized protein n=1 Tax=Xenopus laevis TaxID=8355 RepID=A0A974DAV5_XENLA|nr:hypothetical protein XELAEV_18021121mg [Xenopus laevis]